MDRQAELMGFSSYRIHQSLVEKPLSFYKYWPLTKAAKAEQKEKQRIVMDDAMLQTIMKKYGFKA